MSFATPNYSGALFNKGNERTPFLSMIAGKTAYSNSVEFVLGQDYTSEEGDIPNISEKASLTAPDATFITRSQNTNVTQIFQESIGISYAKQSNMGTLSGANISGQSANPKNELDFQTSNKLKKIARSLEKTCIQGKYNKATSDETVNKKLKAAFKYGLKPIVCVGETLEQREAGKVEEIITNQTKLALEGLTNEQVENTIIALGKEEALNIVDENGILELSCNFCNKKYSFNKEKVLEIFEKRKK